MEKTCDYSICTGCGACSAVCPKNCISFVTGDFGHVYPKIDVTRCIDCNKCRNVCPPINDYSQILPTEAFAGIIKEKEDYLSTTSGGAAQAISLYILRKGGIVYGCGSLSNGRIEHIRVETPTDLELLKGSKYVQSDVHERYQEIIKDVKSGREVLFIGTPCQCAAVKKLFRIQPSNLCLVELICHGVPSQEFLFDYLRKQGVSKDIIGRIWFRTSKGYQIAICNDTQSKIIYESIPLWSKGCKDLYYKTFFYGYSFRPSCYTCKFARPERVGDITIGDFWGLGVEYPTDEIPAHEHGISVVLPCTDKGKEIISNISGIINLYPRSVKEAIKGNHQLQHPTLKGSDVYLFSFLRKILGISYAFQVSFFMRRVAAFIKRRIINGK